jgi:hypothetical protein
MKVIPETRRAHEFYFFTSCTKHYPMHRQAIRIHFSGKQSTIMQQNQ